MKIDAKRRAAFPGLVRTHGALQGKARFVPGKTAVSYGGRVLDERIDARKARFLAGALRDVIESLCLRKKRAGVRPR